MNIFRKISRMEDYLNYVFVCLLCLRSFDATVEGHFITEEVILAKYDVDILSSPIKLGEESKASNLYMTSKYGQQYCCALPELAVPEDKESGKAVGEDSLDVKDLLQPLKKLPCLLKTKDWWTYEFCYGVSVKQYHLEDGQPVGAELTLGLYSSEFDWSNETHRERSKNSLNRYHSQYYTNGSKCDLTAASRATEVRFVCEEDVADYISRVDEPETCSYVLTVRTSRICNHPHLRPLPTTKPHTISCSPLLSEVQYSKYLKQLEEDKKIAEEKRKLWLAKQQEKLQSLKNAVKSQQEQTKDPEAEANAEERDDNEEPSASSDLEKQAKGDLDPANDDAKVEPKQTLGAQVETTTPAEEAEPMTAEDELLKEFENELKNIPEMYKSKKFGLKEDGKQIPERFSALFNEVQEELQDEDEKLVSFYKLAATLNRLLEKMTKEEEAAEELERAKSTTTGGATKRLTEEEEKEVLRSLRENDEDRLEEEEEDDDNTNDINQGERAKEPIEKKPGEAAEEEDDETSPDDGKLRVRIKQVNQDSRALGKSRAFKHHELDGSQKRKLEEAVKQKLEKAGLDTGGRRIEVKIITAGYYDDEDGKDFQVLSDEETKQFQTMILSLLMGNQEAVQEMEKQRKLEKNYRFVWEKEQHNSEEEEEG